MQCRITAVELIGFKCFEKHCTLALDEAFTSIVGPNGCGKSVIGEAIAYALGGSRKMLRARTLQALIHQGSSSAQARTGQDWCWWRRKRLSW